MISKNPSLFIDALCLLVNQSNNLNINLVKQLIEIYNDEIKSNTLQSTPLIKLYINVLQSIIEENIDVSNKSEIQALLHKFKSSEFVIANPKMILQLEEIASPEQKLSDERIEALQQKLVNAITWSKQMKATKDVFGRLQKCNSTDRYLEQKLLLDEIVQKSKEMSDFKPVISSNTSTVEYINMADKESIRHAIHNNKITGGEQGYKLGLQGLNRMLGPEQSLRPGEMMCYPALSHNFKSGILLKNAWWICKYNKPIIPDNRTPVLVFISLENKIYRNLLMWFKDAYFQEYHQKPPADMSEDDIIDHVISAFSVNGIELHVYRKNGDKFGFPEYAQLIDEINQSGKFVIGVIIDYFALLKGTYRLNEPDHLRLPNVCREMMFKAQHDSHFVITAHQLNKDAEVLVKSGTTNAVQRFGAHYFAEATALFRELDIVVFLNIEENAMKIPFLTIQWGKRRYEDEIPSKDKFCAYRFTPLGIYDDINGKDESIHDIYSYKDKETSSEENNSVTTEDLGF